VVGIIYAIITAIFTPSFEDIITGRASSFSGRIWIGAALSAIVGAVLQLGYFAYMESSRGQTLGKMALKLRTYGPNGGNPTMEQAVKRNIWVAASLLGIIPVAGNLLGGLAGLAAVIAIAVTINGNVTTRQGWHDKFAGGTTVIKVG
ncbi:MAG TPA: RDD family protein, partial [Actinomycetaceae bacterium]|nr:RDD family protein [Actinomycetaceae bacterium]